MPKQPTWDDFEALHKKSARTSSRSSYRAFIAGMEPGEVRVFEVPDGVTLEGVRAAIAWAAKQEKISVRTTKVDESTLWVGRPPED